MQCIRTILHHQLHLRHTGNLIVLLYADILSEGFRAVLQPFTRTSIVHHRFLIAGPFFSQLALSAILFGPMWMVAMIVGGYIVRRFRFTVRLYPEGSQITKKYCMLPRE